MSNSLELCTLNSYPLFSSPSQQLFNEESMWLIFFSVYIQTQVKKKYYAVTKHGIFSTDENLCPKWDGWITGFIAILTSVELGLSTLTITAKLHFAWFFREHNHNIFAHSTKVLVWGPVGHEIVYFTSSGKRKWSVRWVVFCSEHFYRSSEHMHTPVLCGKER